MFARETDDDALFAAMTLAMQKRGEFIASGDSTLLAACVPLAALHDLPLASPELQEDLERERARYRQLPPKEPGLPVPARPVPPAAPPKTLRRAIQQ